MMIDMKEILKIIDMKGIFEMMLMKKNNENI